MSGTERAWAGTAGLLPALAMAGLIGCGGGGSGGSTAGAPVLAPIGAQEIQPLRSLVLTLTATDPEGDPLTYSVDPLPPNAAIEASTGLFVFTPQRDQAGRTYAVSFSCTDGRQHDVERVRIHVASALPPSDHAPVLAPIGDQQVHIGATLTMQHHASDADGDAVTFSVSPALPAHATYDSSGQFAFTPTADQVGTYRFSFVASDGKQVDDETITVRVLGLGSPRCSVPTPTGCFAPAQRHVPMSAVDSACPTPATPAPADFCTVPTPTPTPSGN